MRERFPVGRVATTCEGELTADMARTRSNPHRGPARPGGYRGARPAGAIALLAVSVARLDRLPAVHASFGPPATWRGAVIAPSGGAGIGTLEAFAFHPGFLGVLVITFATMLFMRLLQVTTPPVLAVALLPLVFEDGGLSTPSRSS